MKKLCILFILILIQTGAQAQDSCLPRYRYPVKSIPISTGKLAYIEQGKGKTILFIHGLGGNISHWEKLVAELSSSYKCIVVDLPGYGWSGKNANNTTTDQLQYYANVITEFTKKKKIKSFSLAGHSMGAQIATIAALQNKKVKTLLLLAPAGLETFTDKEGQLIMATTQPAIMEKQDETVIRNNFKLNFVEQPADTEKLIEDRLRMRKCASYKTYLETVSAGVKGMLTHPIKDSLQYLNIPVLIAFGAGEALIPNRYFHPNLKTKELATEGAGLIKKSRVEMVDGAGHMLPFEKPRELSQLIKSFLQ